MADLLTITDTQEGQLRHIMLGPPPGNILNAVLMEQLVDALNAAERDAQLKLIVISGSGRHFSFGASVEEHQAEQVGDMLPKFHAMIHKVLSCEIPTIAKVRGMCLGGGFELALACNLIFAEQNAQCGVPEIQLAVFPPAACILLPLRCGDAMAGRIILTGVRFSAKELKERGIVNQTAEPAELDAAIESFFTTSIAGKSARALRIANRAARQLTLSSWETHIGPLERLYLQELMRTADANEGITAFLEKRKPHWKNQ